MATIFGPTAGTPQRLLPSKSISKDEPDTKLQSGCTLKRTLNFCSFSILVLTDPGKEPPGNISDS